MISTWRIRRRWRSSKQPSSTTIPTWCTILFRSRFQNGSESSSPIVWRAAVKNGSIDSFSSMTALTTTNGWSSTTNSSHLANCLNRGTAKAHCPLLTPRCSSARFLTVAEQMVTDFLYEDMTPILNSNSYWASYNNVYFPHFRDISGEEKMAQSKGPQLYSWQNSSRARIFARDHVKVVDQPTMINMMRFVFAAFTFLPSNARLSHGLDTMTSRMILCRHVVVRLPIRQS